MQLNLNVEKLNAIIKHSTNVMATHYFILFYLYTLVVLVCLSHKVSNIEYIILPLVKLFLEMIRGSVFLKDMCHSALGQRFEKSSKMISLSMSFPFYYCLSLYSPSPSLSWRAGCMLSSNIPTKTSYQMSLCTTWWS